MFCERLSVSEDYSHPKSAVSTSDFSIKAIPPAHALRLQLVLNKRSNLLIYSTTLFCLSKAASLPCIGLKALCRAKVCHQSRKSAFYGEYIQPIYIKGIRANVKLGVPLDTEIAAPMKKSSQTAAFFGRGRRTRTLNNGFGDRDVTITLCPYSIYMVGL